MALAVRALCVWESSSWKIAGASAPLRRSESTIATAASVMALGQVSEIVFMALVALLWGARLVLLGSAIALQLLFGIPLLWGVLITAGDVLIILGLIVLNGMLAMAELALVSARRLRLEKLGLEKRERFYAGGDLVTGASNVSNPKKLCCLNSFTILSVRLDTPASNGRPNGSPPPRMIDSLSEGLVDSFCNAPMAITAENLAEQHQITREMQDAFAARWTGVIVAPRTRFRTRCTTSRNSVPSSTRSACPSSRRVSVTGSHVTRYRPARSVFPHVQPPNPTA